VAADVIAIVFRTYIAEQSIDHLATILRKAGIKDLLLFFPPNKREDKALDEYFRKQGLAQVADWWTKKKYAILKEEVIKAIRGNLEHGDSNQDVRKVLSWGVPLLLGLTAGFFPTRLWPLSRQSRKNTLCRRRNSYNAFGRV
jgi:hypothetical protein